MIITEELEGEIIHTYSDQRKYIYGGFPEGRYTDAHDPKSMSRTYIETNEDIAFEDDNTSEIIE